MAELHADRVPLREADMQPWEIMVRGSTRVDEPVSTLDYPRRDASLEEIMLDLLGSPNIAGRHWALGEA